MVTVAIAVFSVAFQSPVRSGPLDSMIVTKTEAFLLLPPMMAAEPIVETFSWSRDGRTLVAARRPMVMDPKRLEQQLNFEQPPAELVRWNVGSKAPKVAFKLSDPGQRVSGINYLGGTGSALVEVSGNGLGTNDYYIVDDIRTRKLELGGDQDWRCTASPYTSAIVGTSFTRSGQSVSTAIKWISASGQVLRSQVLEGTLHPILWTKEGELIVQSNVPNPPVAGARQTFKQTFFKIDQRGKTSPAEHPEYEPDPAHAHGLGVTPAQVSVQVEGRSVRTVVLNLTHQEGESKGAIISTDAGSGMVNSSGDYVAYVTDGALHVRGIAKMPRALYEQAMAAAKKAEIISNAKQAALAAIMFAADNDDNFPPSAGWQDRMSPYLKDSNLLNGFVYSLNGQNASSFDKPAESVLGYIKGPGGRAVAYVDGHVKWVND